MAYEEVEAAGTLLQRRLKAHGVLRAGRWKIQGRNVGRTHLLEQKTKEPAASTDVEHSLAGDIRKPVRRHDGPMIVMPMDDDTVADIHRVVEAYFSAECNEIRVR